MSLAYSRQPGVSKVGRDNNPTPDGRERLPSATMVGACTRRVYSPTEQRLYGAGFHSGYGAPALRPGPHTCQLHLVWPAAFSRCRAEIICAHCLDTTTLALGSRYSDKH